MEKYVFEDLKLSLNELILIEKEGSYQYTGIYLGDYDNSKLTFKFSNYSNGKVETIDLSKLQKLKKLE